MRPRVTPTGWQRGASGRLALALGALALGPAMGAAQQTDSLRVRVVRAVTPYEIEVERLARSLMSAQQRFILPPPFFSALHRRRRFSLQF